MSTAHVIPALSDETTGLSPEQWWALFDKLRLAQQAAYAEVGGSEAFIRHERDTNAPLS